ncbi:MAG: sulfite exporter TauE/SafE family protein [Hyphomicrobium sp.]|uniref:sulfite exporter TauE/SafE family protein n=1 Tax=Hyphomicrobium sp. TaxID=82 RepID=UPI0039E35E6E
MPFSVALSGLGFGLASALHCAAMCGGIACGALLLLDPSTPRQRNRQLALMQAGRVATYATMGAVAGAIGGSFAAAHGGISFQIMQWAAAATLIWMGLVIAGAMPRLAFLDRGISYVGGALETAALPLRKRPTVGPLALGVAWGLNACPMLYGAVFFSSLTGSALNGFLFMAGFGVGTVPAVFAAANGLTFLRTINARPSLRWATGSAIALTGFASVYLTGAVIPGLCLTR